VFCARSARRASEKFNEQVTAARGSTQEAWSRRVWLYVKLCDTYLSRTRNVTVVHGVDEQESSLRGGGCPSFNRLRQTGRAGDETCDGRNRGLSVQSRLGAGRLEL